MEKIKSGAMFAVKVIVTLAITAFVLNLVGVNLFSLITNPIGTIKGLVSKPASA